MPSNPNAASGSAKTERKERLAALDRERRRRERRSTILMWSVLGAVGLIVLGGLAFALAEKRSAQSTSTAAPGVKTYKVEAAHKTGPLTYQQDPPVGGPHNPIWLNCATYTKPVPNENAVHSMEHGAVWVTYDPTLPEADVAKLREKLPSTYAILSPYPGLKDKVVASAWGRQLRATGVDDSRLDDFISTFTQGQQTPEPGASCSGGSDGTVPLGSEGGM